MKIGSLLRAAVVISIGLAAILGWILFSTFEQVNRATERGAVADEIVQGTFNQNILTSDYLLHREERARTQWSAKHDSLTELVHQAEREFKGSDVGLILGTIRENHESSQAVFSELITTSERQVSGSEETAKSQALEEGLTAQLLLKSQDMVSAASQLAETSRNQIETAQKRAGVIVVVLLVIMAMFGIAMLILLSRKVLKPITQLQRGAEIIGEGDLDFRTRITSRDEIGGLSRAFDQMTENLKAITASREELEREVAERRRVEEALRESNLRFQAMLESAPDAVVITSSDGRITLVNSQTEERFGYNRDELLGQAVELLVPERFQQDHPQNRDSYFAHPRRRPMGSGLDITGRRKDGSEFPVDVSLSPVEGIYGPLVISIIGDITERKRAEEALRETTLTLQALIQASPLPIIARDRDAKVRMWNPAAEVTFGWSEEEVLGHPYPLIPEEKQEEFGVNLERSRRGEALAGLETRRQKKDGTQIDVGVWTGPLPDGGAIVVIADITERKQAQETLLQQMRELAVLEERNRLAREIHDSLAQGLVAIIWQLNAAGRAVEGGGEQAIQCLERLRNLARECLQGARRSVWDLRAGLLEGRRLAEALEQELESTVGGGEIETSFVTSGEEQILPSGVEAVLLRICQEALANILKHANATQVTVTLVYDESQVRLAVLDNGVGFDPELPTRRERGGGGFGLINMRERARIVGGELRVDSEPARGTLVEATIGLE